MVFPGEEGDRIERLAIEMGVADPVEDGLLRFEDGHCVFLAEDRLCAIHRRYGSPAKPTLCRQYPLVVLRTESGLRAGVDPGCFTGIATWKTAPILEDDSPIAGTVSWPEPVAAVEARLLDLLGADGMTVAGLARALTGEAGEGMPPAFAARVLRRVQGMDLASLLEERSAGAVFPEALGPLAAAIPTWAEPPPWRLGAEEDAWAIDALRRLIFLRLASHVQNPAAVVVLMLCGVLAAGWTDPRPAPFGAAVAAWTRTIRAGRFVRALAPDAGAVEALVRG
jgi:hypothetical protein